jgi:hypothetical protein
LKLPDKLAEIKRVSVFFSRGMMMRVDRKNAKPSMARTLCRSSKKYADIETLKTDLRLFLTYYLLYPKTKVPK